MSVKWKSLTWMSFTPEEYNQLKEYLEVGTIPPGLSSSAKYNYKNRYAGFSVLDDQIVLYVNENPPWATKDGKSLYEVKLPLILKVVNTEQIPGILERLYKDIKTNGYRKTDSFYDKIRQEFIGIKHDDVRNFIDQLPPNNIFSMASKIVQPIITNMPMQIWQINLSPNLNSYLLICMDLFSKFAWVKNVKDKGPETLSTEIKILILIEGSPRKIQVSQDLEFLIPNLNKIGEEFSIRVEDREQQGTGGVDRFSQTLHRMLSEHRGTVSHSGKLDLQYLVHSYNNTRHDTTRYTPFQVHRGRSQEVKMLHTLVGNNIEKAAESMIRTSTRRNQTVTENAEAEGSSSSMVTRKPPRIVISNKKRN
jgi:hypothetical protein